MLKLGWFSTGRGKGSRDLLTTAKQNIDKGAIDAQISFVFCNREAGEGEGSDEFLHLVEDDFRLPLICLSSRKHRARRTDWGSRNEWRLAYDREIMKLLQPFTPELCVLAGYMLVVGPEMCRKYDMLNLHPAAPGGPAGTWQEVIWKLIETRAWDSGVKMHLAIPELDEGPTVTYCTFPLRGEAFDNAWKEIEGKSVDALRREQGEANSLFRLIRQHGVVRELPLIVSTLRVFADAEVKIRAGAVVDRQGRPIRGYDLTDEIDRAVKGKAKS